MLNSSHTSLQLARSLAIPPPPLPIVLIANVLTPSFRLPLRGTRGGGEGGVSVGVPTNVSESVVR